MKETLKEILFWVIAILFLGMFTCFFSSCGKSYAEEHSDDPSVLKRITSEIYSFTDDSCRFVMNYSGGVIHHPTCNNPKHSCICYNEVYE